MTVNPAHEHHTAPGLATVHVTTTADALTLSSPSLWGSGVTRRRPCRCTSAHAALQTRLHRRRAAGARASARAARLLLPYSSRTVLLLRCTTAPLFRSSCRCSAARPPLCSKLRSSTRRPPAATSVVVGSGYLVSLSTPRVSRRGCSPLLAAHRSVCPAAASSGRSGSDAHIDLCKRGCRTP